MALNFPGPNEVRIRYTTAGIEHMARLNFNAPDPGLTPGMPYDNVQLIRKDGTTVLLALAVNGYIAEIRNFLSAADTTIDDVEVWKYTPNTFQAQFITAETIGVPGLSGASHVPAGQMIMTFRSVEGNILKATLMQGTTLPGPAVLPAEFSTNLDGWANQFISSTGNWIARDTSYIASVRKFLPGQSEALFKRIYR